LFKNFEKKQQLHIHISMISKKILPEHVKFSEKKNYPSFYKNHPHYIYPHTIEFRIVGEVKAPLPTSIQELEDSGRPEIWARFWFPLSGRCRSPHGKIQILGRTQTRGKRANARYSFLVARLGSICWLHKGLPIWMGWTGCVFLETKQHCQWLLFLI
jgi:hypothetical protein